LIHTRHAQKERANVTNDNAPTFLPLQRRMSTKAAMTSCQLLFPSSGFQIRFSVLCRERICTERCTWVCV